MAPCPEQIRDRAPLCFLGGCGAGPKCGGAKFRDNIHKKERIMLCISGVEIITLRMI